jgi:hypothetical protein
MALSSNFLSLDTFFIIAEKLEILYHAPKTKAMRGTNDLAVLDVIILSQDIRGWKMGKIERDLPQAQKRSSYNLNPQQAQNTAGHSYSKTSNIDEGIAFMFFDIS